MTDRIMPIEGGCLCGKVRYRAEPPTWVGHCHCDQCRKHTGAAFATFLWYGEGRVVWLTEEPSVFESSPGVARGFCPSCGSTLTFARLERGGVSLSVGSLDDPNVVEPVEHLFASRRCVWLHMNDGLPAHDRFPPGTSK